MEKLQHVLPEACKIDGNIGNSVSIDVRMKQHALS